MRGSPLPTIEPIESAVPDRAALSVHVEGTTRTVVNGPFIRTRWFVYVKEEVDLCTMLTGDKVGTNAILKSVPSIRYRRFIYVKMEEVDLCTINRTLCIGRRSKRGAGTGGWRQGGHPLPPLCPHASIAPPLSSKKAKSARASPISVGTRRVLHNVK